LLAEALDSACGLTGSEEPAHHHLSEDGFNCLLALLSALVGHLTAKEVGGVRHLAEESNHLFVNYLLVPDLVVNDNNNLGLIAFGNPKVISNLGKRSKGVGGRRPGYMLL